MQPEAHETGKPDGVPEIVTLLFVGATASSAPRQGGAYVGVDTVFYA